MFKNNVYFILLSCTYGFLWSFFVNKSALITDVSRGEIERTYPKRNGTIMSNKVTHKVSNLRKIAGQWSANIQNEERDAYQQWASLFDITKSSNYIFVLLLLYFFGSFYILIYK